MQQHEFINNIANTGRAALTEAESKELLKYYGIPVVEEWIVKTEAEAVRQARE